MNTLDFLKTNHSNKDVHLVQVKNNREEHLGYYFWQGSSKSHEHQLIRDMRLVIELDVLDIRQMLKDAIVVKVKIDGENIEEIK